MLKDELFPRYFVVWPGYIQINRPRKDGFGYQNHSYRLNDTRVRRLHLPSNAHLPPFNGRIIASGYSIPQEGKSDDTPATET